MRNRYLWAGAVALAIGALGQMELRAAYTNLNGTVISNGTIIVTTRAANDGYFFRQSSSSIDDMDDSRGSGTAPGDLAMCQLLEDNGYSTKLLPDKVLAPYQNPYSTHIPLLDVYGNPNDFTRYYDGRPGPSDLGSGTNELLSAMLVVISGSGSSSDTPIPNTNGIPIVCGEHAILGDSISPPNSHGELFLYSNKNSGNITTLGGDYQYMYVVDTNHPIMKGIPLVASTTDTNRRYIKFIRDPYPNENAHVLSPGGLPNYQVSTTWVDLSTSTPAPGLKILGLLAANTNYAIFAVMDKGGILADTTQDFDSPWVTFTYDPTPSPTRIVQFFVCEQGSHNTRRCFNALSVWGRLLFVRCCQWAMWEGPEPYQGLGIIDVGMVSPGNIKLSWTGSSKWNYRIYGATDIVNPNWIPVADSIVNNGEGNPVTRTLDISSAPQVAFLRVGTLPELATDWVRP